MDEASIEAKGLTPLADEMAAITAITNKASLSAYLGSTLNSEVDGLTANADHVLGVWINQGFEDSEHNLPHLWQGGLGLPDRDNYVDPSARMVELRARYQTHIAGVLKLAGFGDSQNKAARILSFETRMARTFAPDSDAANVFKQNNPWKRADFDVRAPGMDWNAYFKSAGLAGQPDFIVWQPSAVAGVSALVATESIDQWRDYLRFHLVEHYASVLPRAVAAEHFSFYDKILPSTQQAPNRVEAAVDATNAALGQAVGQLYVQIYFPDQAKARAQAMVRDLITAFRARIANLTWMSPQTKEKALAKLAALEIGIGYPDTWIDFSAIDIVRGDAFGNVRRAEAFNRLRNLAQVRTTGRSDRLADQSTNPRCRHHVQPNTEFFSAAILQPPFFDSQGDFASNYGSAGAGIAHEVSHSFDELGIFTMHAVDSATGGAARTGFGFVPKRRS
jgi:predicted metalloendopeptidase